MNEIMFLSDIPSVLTMKDPFHLLAGYYGRQCKRVAHDDLGGIDYKCIVQAVRLDCVHKKERKKRRGRTQHRYQDYSCHDQRNPMLYLSIPRH